MIIVGAGFCGLSIASLAAERGLAKCTILEKSRGVGGRLATRRTENAKFDHGAQFLRAKPETEKIRRRLVDREVLRPWFTADGLAYFSARDGMTSIAKDLAQDAVIKLEHRVSKISRTASGWSLELENQPGLQDHVIVMTCPLPQSLEILKVSNVPFDPALSQIRFEKALVMLFESATSNAVFPNADGYLEPADLAIFSIADQRAKGVSPNAAWTVTMSAAFSEEHFDRAEAETIEQIEHAVRKFDSSFKWDQRQLKKWRYCRPTSRFTAPFAKVSDGLYLAGDAFGGASLNGAFRSAEALISSL